MAYEMILTETEGATAIIRLNRPKALNALCDQLMRELGEALRAYDADPAIAAIIITGSERAFAAGADIKEMQDKSFAEMHLADWFAVWEEFTRLRKPCVAAVAGYALGGGCEVAMMCDFIIAAENAKFGQPEVKLGVMPGMGGSQRLTRLVGQAKAMDMCLTGRMMDAQEAERSGLAARVVPTEKLRDEALAAAKVIAEMPLTATLSIKDAVRRAQEIPLTEGVRYERRLFHALFATHDQKEGMAAFVEKRAANFAHR